MKVSNKDLELDDNPYKSPPLYETSEPSTKTGNGIWRDGDLLVVPRKALLPPVCVASNMPADTEVVRKFYWHPPQYFLFLCIHFFIYIIVAFYVRRRHDLTIPLSGDVAAQRWNKILTGWGIGLAGLTVLIPGMFVLGASLVEQTYILLSIVTFTSGFTVAIAGIVIAVRASMILTPKKMTAEATWFKGANPEYLKSFPVAPPNETWES